MDVYPVMRMINFWIVDNVTDKDNDAMDLSNVQDVPSWDGFRVISDNLDKNVRPRFTRLDRKTQSLHFFHVYASVNLSTVSDDPNLFLNTSVENLPVESMLPMQSSLLSNFSVLVSRVLTRKLQYYL